MRKTTTRPTAAATKKSPRAAQNTNHPPAITRTEVKETVDEMLRSAFRDHSRDMEKHLRNIHERLVALERLAGGR